MTLLFGNRSPWRLFLSFSKGGLSPVYRTPPLMYTVFFVLTLEGMKMEGIGVAPLLIG